MTPRAAKFLFCGLLGTLVLTLMVTAVPAQPPGIPAIQPGANDDGAEVLARGPVHEAFASTVEMPQAGEIAPKAPPEAIEELPPDQRPEGDNVQWIPGYWDWDEERKDFIWISGFWRVPPPDHVWIAGSWNAVATGYQWTSGFWQLTQPNQPMPELEYLPTPPAPIEFGPSVPAPDSSSVYVSGCWLWRDRYVWRPGYWIAHRPGWVWAPAHYRWTPLGYVFINGYWDYPLAARGVLFAPVYYPRRVFAPGYLYTPRYVIAEPVLFGAFFVRRGYSSYYFGDYYDARYGRRGYQPWCAPALRGAVAVVPARGWNYDPLWNYYSVNHRQNPQWQANVKGLYVGRYEGSLPRPQHTLVQQNQAIQRAANIANVPNVTNSLAVVDRNFRVNNRDVSQHVMVAPLAAAPKLQSETKLQPISQQVRQNEAKHAAEIRQAAVNRQRAEAEAVKSRPQRINPPKGQVPAPQRPVKLKFDVPKPIVARAQAPDQPRQPLPRPALPKSNPAQPPVQPRVNPPKLPAPPKSNPAQPPVQPRVNPPKPPVVQPRFDPPKPPVVQPRVNPPKPPVVQPRVNPPKPPVVQPRNDPPKPVVQPRNDPPKPPVVRPRFDPPKPVIQPRNDPPKPVIQPRVNPSNPPVVRPSFDPPKPPADQPRVNRSNPPVVRPRFDPPKTPVVQPRVNPPKPPAARPNREQPRRR